MKQVLCSFLCVLLLMSFTTVYADEAVWSYPVPLRDCISEYAILVNETHLLESSYKPTALTKVSNSTGIKRATKADVYLEDTMLKALQRMFESALSVTEYTYTNEKGVEKVATFSSGMVLYLKSGYRSYGTQKTTYANHLAKTNNVDDGFVAKPGASEHQTGLCADILNEDYASRPTMTQDFKYTPEAQWLKENCSEFGFILRYTEEGEAETGIRFEPWHFRYVGKNAAVYIMDSGISLEEFYEESQEAVSAFLAAGGDKEEQIAKELLATNPVLDSIPLDEYDETGDREITISY